MGLTTIAHDAADYSYRDDHLYFFRLFASALLPWHSSWQRSLANGMALAVVILARIVKTFELILHQLDSFSPGSGHVYELENKKPTRDVELRRDCMLLTS